MRGLWNLSQPVLLYVTIASAISAVAVGVVSARDGRDQAAAMKIGCAVGARHIQSPRQLAINGDAFVRFRPPTPLHPFFNQ
jgi:hypothetical protein